MEESSEEFPEEILKKFLGGFLEICFLILDYDLLNYSKNQANLRQTSVEVLLKNQE